MKRKKVKKADAIIIADIHLTDSTPVSRTDDYQKAQETKLKFIRKLSEKNNKCPILCAGDIFEHWKASPWLSSWAYQYIPWNFITVPGNHDLPGHSFKQYPKSALALLDTVVPQIEVLKNDTIYDHNLEISGIPFGQLDEFESTFYPADPGDNRTILLLHELVWEKQKPEWAKGSYTATEIIDRFGTWFDLIVTGDNHMSFVVKQNDTLLVNPGSMMRRTADQMEFQPKCYLYYANVNIVKAVNIPIQKDVFNTDHLIKKKEKDDRITAYIERMKDGWETGLSFRRNLEAFFAENGTPKKVRGIIWEALETTN